MSEVQSLIATTMQAEFKAFLEQLEASPAEAFSTQPAQGHSAYGHSVAWHALHIMDWTRCVIQPGLNGVNPALTYGYLGFEQEPWAQAVHGPTLAHEQDGKEKILMALDTVFAEALSAVQHAPAERFSTDALWTTLKKPKPVLDGLMYHIRHVAYHRGQVQMVTAGLKREEVEWICSECGETQIPFADGACMGMRCPNCGIWGVVATNPDALLAARKPLPCPVCNQPLNLEIKDNAWNFTCESCGYAGFSPRTPDIYRDSTQYQVTMIDLKTDKKQHLLAVAKVLDIGAAAARNIIKDQGSIEHFCDAIEAVKIRSILLESNVRHDFSPELKFNTLGLVPYEEFLL